MCVCVCERERERERDRPLSFVSYDFGLRQKRDFFGDLSFSFLQNSLLEEKKFNFCFIFLPWFGFSCLVQTWLGSICFKGNTVVALIASLEKSNINFLLVLRFEPG